MESGQCLHATFHPQAVLILAVTVYHSTGSDQGDGKREGAEQAGVQGARKALVGCRGNTPAGGGGGEEEEAKPPRRCRTQALVRSIYGLSWPPINV